MYHIFFIHSSVNGHLGCFHVLAIVNSAICIYFYLHHFHYALKAHSHCYVPMGSITSDHCTLHDLHPLRLLSIPPVMDTQIAPNSSAQHSVDIYVSSI